MGRRCHGAVALALALVAYAGGASFVGARLERRQLQVKRGSLDKAFELPPETGQHSRANHFRPYSTIKCMAKPYKILFAFCGSSFANDTLEDQLKQDDWSGNVFV